MTKYARIDKDHTVVTSKAKSGAHRGEKDFKAGPDPVSVTQAQLDSIVAAGAGEETAAPAAAGKAATDGAKTAPTGSGGAAAPGAGAKA